jgi:Pro-kumamolisin, activation domain
MRTALSPVYRRWPDRARRERRPVSSARRVPARRATFAPPLFLATLAVTAGVAFALAPAAPASATPSTQMAGRELPAKEPAEEMVALAGATPPSPASFGAKTQGAAPGSAALSLQIYFQPDHAAQLAVLATAVSTPGNPSYHHFLSVPEFAARFGPSDQVVSALDKYLGSKGLLVGRLSANRLAQDVTGTAGQFERALGAPLVRMRTAKGAEVIGSLSGPKLPGNLAGSVAFVDGLDPWVVPSTNLVRLPPHQVVGAQR